LKFSIKDIPDLRISRKENFQIKETNRDPRLHEIAELIYESYKGDPASTFDKVFLTIFFTFFFVVSTIFIPLGVGLISWAFSLTMLYKILKSYNQIETFFVDKSNNLLVKETIAFGRIERDSWDIGAIRKFLIGLDVDISSSSGMSGVGGTSTRSDYYTLTMILDEPEEEKQGQFGQFETVDILKTKIEPRFLELGLEIAQRFEDVGFKVERMVRTIRVNVDDLLCQSCNSINQPDARYCATCGTYLDEVNSE
jgi:hypothetical protein